MKRVLETEQSNRVNQGLTVRPEARAREFGAVARLIPSGKKPKGNRGGASSERPQA